MGRFLRIGFLSLIALQVVGCGPRTQKPGPVVDLQVLSGQKAFDEIAPFLALGDRHATTPGAEAAAQYIRARCTALGMNAWIDTFEDETPDGTGTFHNVVAEIPGQSDELIILGGHFDTKIGIEGFVGANDGGSSTGLLLELGRVLSENPIRQRVRIYFFDGEECQIEYGDNDGFHGSRYAAMQLVKNNEVPLARAMINLDMVGDRDLSITLPDNSSRELASLTLKAAEKIGQRSKFSLFNGTIGDDHIWFLKLGIPAIDLIDFKFGASHDSHEYWHTAEDSIDKLSPESLEIVGQVTLEILNKLSEGE